MASTNRTRQHAASALGSLSSVACVALATACGPTPSPEPPPQLLNDAAQAMQSVSSFAIHGGFEIGSLGVNLNATALHDGDASGSLALGSATSNFVVAHKQLYFDTANSLVTDGVDASIGPIIHFLKGMHWWQVQGTDDVRAALRVLDPSQYQQMFFSGRGQLIETPQKDSKGRNAIKVTDNAATIFVAPDAPHDVLEIQTTSHALTMELSDVDIVFDKFNAAAAVSPPPSPISPTADGMPRYFAVQSIEVDGDCDQSGCPLKATIVSVAGSGSATVDFSVTDKAGTNSFGTCSATAAIATVGGSGTANCHTSGSGWSHFYYGGGGTYGTKAAVENPDYQSPTA
ncbi:MAG: hypothetical protein ABR498_07705 [Candidatus Dormibacteria bacterium]